MVVSTVQLTLIGKPGCHLCDVARDVITAVISEQTIATSVELAELSLIDDPQLMERYSNDVPVVLINGTVHTIWRVDAGRLRLAILEANQ